jgi:uncharacterized protein YgiM (DUF1202 family)
MLRRGRLGLSLLAAALALVTAPVYAAPGDTYRVTGEKANLRSAASDQSTVRSTLVKGDQVLELRSDGHWLGVRALKTGEEGWIYSDLVQPVAQSALGGADATRRQAGFVKLSPGFDELMSATNEEIGYPLADRVDVLPNNTLRVTPTAEWLYNTGREAKIYAALAIYEMWKNYNNGRPVTVSLGDTDADAIVIGDATNGSRIGFRRFSSLP